jgi:hypothetical protein
MKNFRLVCQHCDEAVLTTDRVSDGDIDELEAHLTAEHPGKPTDSSTGRVAMIFRHFRVQRRRDDGSGYHPDPYGK